jgi:2-polyprenyl-3-methyl-5-hydroxy-6-metoxy-1,4-benzoquinol methylase
LDGMIVADIEKDDSYGKILKATKKKKFDVVMATSLIEHLGQPDAAVRRMASLLKANGKLILTTPNIAHWSIRWLLLRGKFDYTEYGILDNTHLHLFTMKTFRELFEQNGFHIEDMKIDAEGGGMPRLSLLMAPFFPGLFAYQILIVAKKK